MKDGRLDTGQEAKKLVIDLKPWGLMRKCDGRDSGLKGIAATTRVGDKSSWASAVWFGRLYKLFLMFVTALFSNRYQYIMYT